MKKSSRETGAGTKENAAASGRPDGFHVSASGNGSYGYKPVAGRMAPWPGEVTQEEKASLAGSR